MKIENLKAEYMDDKLTYEFLHNGKVVEGCIPKVHYRASFYDVQQVEETYDTNTTTSYTFTKGTNIEGLHIQVFLMDIVDGKTCVVESLIKLTVKNDWDGDLATTSLIPHIKTQTYVSLETNPNKEVAMQKDYKIDAVYICDYITISVKNNGEEYIETINNFREYTSLDNIEYIQPENGFEKRKYNLVHDTKHGFRFVIKIHDLVSKKTGSISKSYLKVDLITDDYQTITTPFIPRKEPQMSENQDKYHDGGSFADDENFQEEPIGPDTDPNGNLASLEAKINELTELVLNQHRVITHMSDMMSIVHFDLLRLISHYRPTTPYCPSHQPPTTPGFYPPHQPPAGYYLSDANVYPARFNPQQPTMGNCAGMGQGLYRNPVPQQSSPTAGQMADHLTYWGNFANQNYSMANMVNMGSDSVKFTNSETPTHHTTSNSVLDQMNGLNQRMKAQQQPTATKEEIKDQANFRSNFPK